MNKARICHEIVIDKDAGEVRLDGLPFPFHVLGYPSVDGTGRDEVPTVGLDVIASNVTIIDQGRTTRPVVATHATEIAWAREEGRRIVRRGLADVDPEQIAAREHAPIFEAVMAERDGSGER